MKTKWIAGLLCAFATTLVLATSLLAAEKTGPKPFVCSGGCNKVLGYCNGNAPGAKCLYVYHATGRWKCPHCGKEYYEISHTH